MPPGSHKQLVQVDSVEAIHELKTSTAKASEVLLVQVGSPQCPLCVPFGEQLNHLKTHHTVNRVYCDAFEAPEVTEEYGIKKLPAALLWIPGGIMHVLQNTSASEVQEALNKSWPDSVFTTDADF